MSCSRIFAAPAAALAAALFSSLLPAQARAQSSDAEGETADQVVIKYTGAAGAHAVSGSARQLEWSVIALPGGSAKVLLRIPLEAFESGHPADDAALHHALEGERFPTIEVEGIAHASALPVRFNGTLRLHGQERPFTALLSLARSGGQLAVSTDFSIDLEEFGIELPLIEGNRLERKLDLDVSMLFSLHPQAVVSGGFISPAREAQ